MFFTTLIKKKVSREKAHNGKREACVYQKCAVTANGHGACLSGDKNGLELDSSDACTS